MAIGLVVAIFRFINGIGAVSNLSDGRAWGLWISFDLFCGVALAAGGFTLAATVYIFRLKKYYPIVRAGGHPDRLPGLPDGHRRPAS
jgi:Ni/Fe-hydrogenase subunit HybB-like protein